MALSCFGEQVYGTIWLCGVSDRLNFTTCVKRFNARNVCLIIRQRYCKLKYFTNSTAVCFFQKCELKFRLASFELRRQGNSSNRLSQCSTHFFSESIDEWKSKQHTYNNNKQQQSNSNQTAKASNNSNKHETFRQRSSCSSLCASGIWRGSSISQQWKWKHHGV